MACPDSHFSDRNLFAKKLHLIFDLLSVQPPYQFPAAIRADIFHIRGALFAKSAFARADHGHAICRQ
jgi:hypothetical protein